MYEIKGNILRRTLYYAAFIACCVVFCAPEQALGFEQGQPIGDSTSNISSIGGFRVPTQLFTAVTTTTIRRIITYPEVGSSVYLDCAWAYDSGGSTGIQLWTSGFGSLLAADFVATSSTPADSSGACIYDSPTGVPVTSGSDYNLVFFVSNIGSPEFYGTVSGPATFGYRQPSSAPVYGTIGLSSSKYYVSDTAFIPPPPDESTRFTSVVLATSTQEVVVSGYIGPEWNSTTNRIRFNQSNVLYSTWRFEEQIATTSGAFTYTFDYLPITSTSTQGFDAQTFEFSILNYTNCQTDFGQTAVCPLGQPTLAATSTVFTLDPFQTPESILTPEYYASLVGTTTCSISALDGCIRNSFIWAFAMSPSSAEKYNDMKQILSTKEPLGIVFYTISSVRSISASTTPTISYFIADGVQTGIIDPMRIGLVVLIVVFHLFALYKWGFHFQLS